MTKLINKVLVINERRTSMRLCQSEWMALEKICFDEGISRNRLIELVENKKNSCLGLTYLTRLFTLFYFYNKALRPQDVLKQTRGENRISIMLDNLCSPKNATKKKESFRQLKQGPNRESKFY